MLRVLPFLFTWAALTLLFAIVPNRRVEWRHAVAGGLLAGVVFEATKRAFAYYLSNFANYALIYGAFATIPIFLIWLYISWLVVLAGATFTAVLPGYRGAAAERDRSPGRDLAEALAVFELLVHAQLEGRVVPLTRLAAQVRLLPYRVERILERAARLGWTARTEKEGWVLARDAASIKVADLYRAFVFDAEAVGVADSDLELSLREYAEKEQKGWQALREPSV
jgi:membrane protein